MLVRAPDTLKRDDARLAAFLAAWPGDLPLTVELRDPSWQADETVTALTDAGATLCASDDPDEPSPPTLRRTGPFLYLRLRRHDYAPDEIATWADRLAPFLDAGDDAFVFFRHDPVGRGPELALELRPPWRPVAGPWAGRPPGPGDPTSRARVAYAREYSAGPKATRSTSRSSMSWNRCVTPAATKIDRAGADVPDLVPDRHPSHAPTSRRRARPRCAATGCRRHPPPARTARRTGPGRI